MTRISVYGATVAALFAFSGLSLLAKPTSGDSERVSAAALIHEMNVARQNPGVYAAYVEEARATFNGKFFVLPGETKVYPKEGLRALDEALHFLRAARAEQPLVISPGMCHAAADHCADQAGGAIGHDGSDRSNPAARINRYGLWTLGWGENISYGKTSARGVVLALIIDDGIAGRKHRKNIFNPKFNFAGAGFGPHARLRTVCSIDFAGGYNERGQELDHGLVARNN